MAPAAPAPLTRCTVGVFLVELRIDELGEEFWSRRQAQLSRFVPLVFRLAQHELTAIGVVTEIQPIVAIPVGVRAGHRIAGWTRIHAANQNVGFLPAH